MKASMMGIGISLIQYQGIGINITQILGTDICKTSCIGKNLLVLVSVFFCYWYETFPMTVTHNPMDNPLVSQ